MTDVPLHRRPPLLAAAKVLSEHADKLHLRIDESERGGKPLTMDEVKLFVLGVRAAAALLEIAGAEPQPQNLSLLARIEAKRADLAYWSAQAEWAAKGGHDQHLGEAQSALSQVRFEFEELSREATKP